MHFFCCNSAVLACLSRFATPPTPHPTNKAYCLFLRILTASESFPAHRSIMLCCAVVYVHWHDASLSCARRCHSVQVPVPRGPHTLSTAPPKTHTLSAVSYGGEFSRGFGALGPSHGRAGINNQGGRDRQRCCLFVEIQHCQVYLDPFTYK